MGQVRTGWRPSPSCATHCRRRSALPHSARRPFPATRVTSARLLSPVPAPELGPAGCAETSSSAAPPSSLSAPPGSDAGLLIRDARTTHSRRGSSPPHPAHDHSQRGLPARSSCNGEIRRRISPHQSSINHFRRGTLLCRSSINRFRRGTPLCRSSINRFRRQIPLHHTCATRFRRRSDTCSTVRTCFFPRAAPPHDSAQGSPHPFQPERTQYCVPQFRGLRPLRSRWSLPLYLRRIVGGRLGTYLRGAVLSRAAIRRSSCKSFFTALRQTAPSREGTTRQVMGIGARPSLLHLKRERTGWDL
jgi:hypothetical protein